MFNKPLTYENRILKYNIIITLYITYDHLEKRTDLRRCFGDEHEDGKNYHFEFMAFLLYSTLFCVLITLFIL